MMAADVYLQIDGITGESTDADHKGWIELLTAQWGVNQPRSACGSSAGGHTAERCEVEDIPITKLADLASPLLFQQSASGKTIQRAKLQFMRADGERRVPYYEITLENVLIGSMRQSYPGAGIIMDHFSLKFGTIKLKYTQQKIEGGQAGNVTGGWSVSGNRIA